MEKWADVKGMEDYFEVSNLGRLRSKERFRENVNNGVLYLKKSKILHQSRLTKGYCRYSVNINGVKLKIACHRAVAEAFIPNPENKSQVNHINGIKTDNKAENLEWCTPLENSKHAKDVLKYKPNYGKKLFQLDLKGKLVKKWDSLSHALKAGYSKKNIYEVINGKITHHLNCLWVYEGDPMPDFLIFKIGKKESIRMKSKIYYPICGAVSHKFGFIN